MNRLSEHIESQAQPIVRVSTSAAEPKTLVDAFVSLTRKHKRPDILNFKRDGVWVPVSSDVMLARIRRIAAGLNSIGVKHGDRVAILSESRVEWTLADAGCLFAGVIDVPIYPTLTPSQVRYILNDSGCRVLILANHAKFLEIKDVLPDCPDSQRRAPSFSRAGSWKHPSSRSSPRACLHVRRLRRSWCRRSPRSG